MQITIPQIEIEQAITNYIKSLININEGMEVTIELKATRGETGMQAVIDITPAKQPVVNVSQDKPRVEPTIKAVKVTAEKAQEIKVTPTQPWPINEDAEEATGAASNASQEASPKSAPKSLFGNLQKPVNPKPEATEPTLSVE